MIDETEVLIAYLNTVAGVTAQVSTRIYGPPGLPTGYAGATKALVVMPDGAGMETDVPIQGMPFQFRCYGDTPANAHDVYEAVHDALHSVAMGKVTVGATKVLLGQGRRLSGPVYWQEPETGWHFWLARYSVILSDRTVT
jgi:hypothetical protein